MMGGGGGGGGGGCRSRYPFTLSQWQELELQALVFRYMASGIPVPSDLVPCIRRRPFVDPQTLPFLPNLPAIGWGAYQMGDARKAMDPEPGRCRRTDGKKWRCSKEAYPDSKYCERHMHRGKSRSRKPVELSLATSPVVSSNFQPRLLPRPPPPAGHFPFSCSSSTESYRSVHGLKEGVNEYPFLMESFGQTDMRSKHPFSRILASEQEMEKQYFLPDVDLKIDRPGKLEELQPRPFHCFLDEKPPKVEDSWMSMNVDHPKTQLSISLPMANHDMPVIASRRFNGSSFIWLNSEDHLTFLDDPDLTVSDIAPWSVL
ncbi:growth-regulating factor 6-like [Curcuma longa]|uniref:growth-regulating factor 6-like n=1 Tax=Curcuma longa TaxID=136217 RepID=UPI003D9E57B0